MSLQRDDVRKIAHLARLELHPDEIDSLTTQLGAIVDYVHQLHEVDTDGVEPFTHPLDIENVFRDDEPAPSLDVESALANAPARQGSFYRVPPVLD